MPLLAEAAPQEFLDAVAVGLKGPKPVLAAIFQDGASRSLFGAHSPHTGFLWAIETVAWSTQYLAHAVDVLAALDRVDPGGTFSNRPFASIENILCPAIQGTSADFPTCLAVVDRLRKRWPDTAWRVMASMLPNSRATMHRTRTPVFREWMPERRAVPLVADRRCRSTAARRSE